MSASEAVSTRSRREQMAAERASKRPSRAGVPAGTSEPDPVADDLDRSGFDGRLAVVLDRARAASTVDELFTTLLTLDGDLTESEGLRAPDRLDLAALRVLREGRARLVQDLAPADTPFLSEVGLDAVGRLVVTSPLRRDLGDQARGLGVAGRLAWSPEDVTRFGQEVPAVREAEAAETAECRDFLAAMADEERGAAVARLRAALLSVPPVQLNRGRTVLSNLRDETNLTGKTLSPHSPQCFFTDLDALPLSLWDDDEVVVVTCLWLSFRSGGPHRIESMNGAQLDLDRVWDNFRTVQQEYRAAFVSRPTPQLPTERPPLPGMLEVADQLNRTRTALIAERALAHRIVGATRSKREFALPAPQALSAEEAAVVSALREVIPGTAACRDLAGLRSVLAMNPWLVEPAGEDPSGIEATIATTVAAAVEAFDADYALSRGIRDYPALVRAVLDRHFDELVRWELPSFYCCVVPSSGLATRSGGDALAIADAAWAMSARMQYNTWHVVPGNLPRNSASGARDFFSPQVLPDVADNMDFFHRGHIVNLVKHTLRSPERVEVAGLGFNSLTDLRLVRTEDRPFTPRELSVVMRLARFLADTLEDLAAFCVRGRGRAITSFDSAWHRAVATRKVRA